MRRVAAISIFLLLATAIVAWCEMLRVVAPAEALPKVTDCAPLRRVRIAFAGDIMCHSPQLRAAQRVAGYDFSALFQHVKPIFEQADLVVANLETTLSQQPPYSGYPLFRSPADLARAAAEAGVDVLMTANNHSLDAGASGVRSTINILDKYQIAHTGTAANADSCSPLIVERGGVRLALLNYTYATNGIPTPDGVAVNRIDTVAMAADIARCADADVRVCFLHWGVEYSRRASAEQRRIREFLNRHGIAVVIGAHPHVVQTAECEADNVVVYSLGNFVSNQSERYTDGGIVAVVDAVETSPDVFEYFLNIIPVWVRRSDYAVVPKNVGDTLRMDASQRAAYGCFMSDVEQLFRKM